MTHAVGIDIVHVQRFNEWGSWSDQKLRRIFSVTEIAYAKQNALFTAQRFAVRFAAKEAFFKAFQQLYPEKKISLLTVMNSVFVAKKESGQPYLVIDHEKIGINSLKANLSLSHTACCATAVVQLQLHNH